MPSRALDAVFPEYLQLLEELHQAAIVTDAQGRITYWSDAATRLYGWGAADVAGRNIVDVTPADVSRGQAGRIMRAIARGQVWSGRFTVRDRLARSFTVDVTDVPVITPDGQVAAVIGISGTPEGDVDLIRVLLAMVAASHVVWPYRLALRSDVERAVIAGSQPHILQLLSLLLIRFRETLAGRKNICARLAPASSSRVADFVAQPALDDMVYLGLAPRTHEGSLLRDRRDITEPAYFAGALVRLLGGALFAGRSGDDDNSETLHLLLPVTRSATRFSNERPR